MMMSSLALYPNEEEYLEYWSFYDQPLNDAVEDVFQLAFDGHLLPTQSWKSAAHPDQRLHRLCGPSSRSSEAEPADSLPFSRNASDHTLVDTSRPKASSFKA